MSKNSAGKVMTAAESSRKELESQQPHWASERVCINHILVEASKVHFHHTWKAFG